MRGERFVPVERILVQNPRIPEFWRDPQGSLPTAGGRHAEDQGSGFITREDVSETKHGFSTSGAWIFHGHVWQTLWHPSSGSLGRLWEKGVLTGAPPRQDQHHPMSTVLIQNPAEIPSWAPLALLALVPAHPRPCSNGQGCVLLFVFQSPTDEERWVTTQIFTCGNRLF